jgi:hypothetical protein
MARGFTPTSVAVLSICAAVTAACSATPVQPGAAVAEGQRTSGVAAPSPSPTPDVKCRCSSVTVQFEPGGDAPSWGTFRVTGNSTWRVGFRINVTCTGTGQSNLCTVFQNESGTLSWTVGGKTGQIVGKNNKVTKFEKAKVGDPWQKEYSDALGADYPPNSTDQMSITLNMDFEIKCVSSDGTTTITKKFKVQGSVDAQAAMKGAQPTLSNATLTLLLQG